MIVKVRVVYEFEVDDGLYQETLDSLREDLMEILAYPEYLKSGMEYEPSLIYISAIEIPGTVFGRPYGEIIDEYN